MATVSKTWVFNTTTENIVLNTCGGGGTPVVNYNSTLSSLNIAYVQATASTEEFATIANATATTENWQSWGVPADSNVTNVEIVSYEYQINAVTGLDGDATVAIRIIDSGGASILASDLVSESMTGSRDTWIAGAPNGSVSVNSGKQASNTSVRLQIEIGYITDGSTAASIQHNLDNILLQMTYTTASGGTQRKYYIIT